MILLTYPDSVFLEVTSLVTDTIWMFKPPKEPDFFEDILPFLQGLLPRKRHFLNGHNLWKEER